MSTLSRADKTYLEGFLGTGEKFPDALGFNSEAFKNFFIKRGVDIYGEYNHYLNKDALWGLTLAIAMSNFLTRAPDEKIASILRELIEKRVTFLEMKGLPVDQKLHQTCKKIILRLSGKEINVEEDEGASLPHEFNISDAIVEKLPVKSAARPIIKNRLKEAKRILGVKAYLSTIILWGSVLEAVLLGTAEKNPEKFKQSSKSPKKNKSKEVRPLNEWSLSQLIDVAYDIGFLSLDIQESSRWLKKFRNYIHPHKQLSSKFYPKKLTAGLCFQALEIALAELAESEESMG